MSSRFEGCECPVNADNEVTEHLDTCECPDANEERESLSAAAERVGLDPLGFIKALDGTNAAQLMLEGVLSRDVDGAGPPLAPGEEITVRVNDTVYTVTRKP